MMSIVSQVCSPTTVANNVFLLGSAGSKYQLNRLGFRNPYAQISLRAPANETNGLSLGMRYRPFSLTLLESLSWPRSGTMRRIFPTRLSRRCGFCRMSGFDDSPDLPSPQAMYRTRQSG